MARIKNTGPVKAKKKEQFKNWVSDASEISAKRIAEKCLNLVAETLLVTLVRAFLVDHLRQSPDEMIWGMSRRSGIVKLFINSFLKKFHCGEESGDGSGVWNHHFTFFSNNGKMFNLLNSDMRKIIDRECLNTGEGIINSVSFLRNSAGIRYNVQFKNVAANMQTGWSILSLSRLSLLFLSLSPPRLPSPPLPHEVTGKIMCWESEERYNSKCLMSEVLL